MNSKICVKYISINRDKNTYFVRSPNGNFAENTKIRNQLLNALK